MNYLLTKLNLVRNTLFTKSIVGSHIFILQCIRNFFKADANE